jgi:hypothetical protein
MMNRQRRAPNFKLQGYIARSASAGAAARHKEFRYRRGEVFPDAVREYCQLGQQTERLAMKSNRSSRYSGYQFPPEIISYVFLAPTARAIS